MKYAMLFIVLVLALLGSGCDSTGVRMTTQEEAGIRAVLRAQTSGVISASKASGSVELDQVKLLIKTVQFNRVEDDRLQEFKSESMVLSLDLSGQVNTVIVGAVPTGTYNRVTFKIHKPEDAEAVPDPDFREGLSGNQRYSMIVRGRFDGNPFVLKLRDSFQQRLALTPPLVITPEVSEVAVTLVVDVGQWFTARNDHLLDPRNADEADQIVDNIRHSFRVIGQNTRSGDDRSGDQPGEDRDDDGEDEDHEIHGAISEVGADFLVVSGIRFEVDANTEFKGLSGLQDLVPTLKVEIKYVVRADGSLLATRIKPED